ncbi:MAG: hypothetical protein HY699_00415 [Deltaproteobacteria bacterium]|nr:hypothetical protein [Deltaproteobacteria bacterium]
MRERWVGAIVGLLVAAVICSPPARSEDSVFRHLSTVTLSGAAALPAGNLHLVADVVAAGTAKDGAWLDLADPGDPDQHLLLVYGQAADGVYGKYLSGRRVELQFRAAGRTKLPDGRDALRVSLGGMKAVAQPTPSP